MSNNWPIVGNGHVVEYLSRCLALGRIEQTYIFEGLKDLGKNTVLKYFIQCLLCAGNKNNRTEPCGKCRSCVAFGKVSFASEENSGILISDLHFLERPADKKRIGIEQVREFIRQLNLSSFLGRYKIGVIKDSEFLSQGAANALLKTLEEPKNDVIIFLLTRSAAALPKTIVSRAQVLRLRPVATVQIYDFLLGVHGAKRSEAKQLSHLSLGRPALAVKYLKDKEFLHAQDERSEKMIEFFQGDTNQRLSIAAGLFDRRQRGQEAEQVADDFIDSYEGFSRDLILYHFGAPGRLRHIERQDDIAEAAKRLGAERISRAPALAEARQYLSANVKPATVLEYLAISV